jgi:hypothetical protein
MDKAAVEDFINVLLEIVSPLRGIARGRVFSTWKTNERECAMQLFVRERVNLHA